MLSEYKTKSFQERRVQANKAIGAAVRIALGFYKSLPPGERKDKLEKILKKYETNWDILITERKSEGTVDERFKSTVY